MSYGFIKAAALSPKVTVAAPEKNAQTALEMLQKAASEGVQLAVLPELHLSAYTCADLFHQDALIKGCEEALGWLLRETASLPLVFAVGLPVRAGLGLYNCAAVCQAGKILGLTPKAYIPNYQEFYEKRWFLPGSGPLPEQAILCGQAVPFGPALYKFGPMLVGVEVCEDLWVPVPQSSMLCLAGANLILNLSASNELVAKNGYRRGLVSHQSAGCVCGYLYASAGVGESTTDLVFSGACMVAENGAILAENRRFEREGSMAAACIDLQRLEAERRKDGSFYDNAVQMAPPAYPVIEGRFVPLDEAKIDRVFDPAPFIPSDPRSRDERCQEILAIQAAGLAKRLSHTGLARPIIGISGGLDSTLALLVSAEAMKLLGYSNKNILAVTMPGFGTTDGTYQNALELIDALGAERMEIDIKPACLQHMADIGHDPSVHDITYENTQARQRTYLLMDLSNKHGGILVGTGDLSELAMGWCTYNADHMSMYGVNASVPKTLVRHLVAYAAGESDERVAAVLKRVLDTPVSPELLPPDEAGQIKQKTEEQIGPYELHDFFLYHFLRFGCSRDKLRFMAERAFVGKYDAAAVEKWLDLFMRRFFISQFKRSCMPDGPKVGSVSLSPRGDWRMPSDAAFL